MNAAPNTKSPILPQRHRSVVLIFAAVFAVGNLAFFPLSYQPSAGDGAHMIVVCLFVVPWIGIIGSQVGLIATWCVFAPIGGWRRVCGTLGLSAFVFTPLVFGDAVFRLEPIGSNEPVVVLLLLLIGMITTQLLLWTLKAFWGWRISNELTMPPEDRRGQFSIRHLLGLTALIGVLIVATQSMFQLLGAEANVQIFSHAPLPILPSIGVMVILIPALYAILRNRPPLWIGWTAYCVAAMTLLGLWGLIMEGRSGDPVSLIISVVGLPIGLAVPLALARREGYRLWTGRVVEIARVES
jgi:hypothetical protein